MTPRVCRPCLPHRIRLCEELPGAGIRVCFFLYVFFNWSPRLGFRICGPVRYVPWYLFLSSSRSRFVICEHPEAPQAGGVPDNPINQASLIQLSDIFPPVFSLERNPLVLLDSPSHVLIHTRADFLYCFSTDAPHSGWGDFKTCLTPMPIFFLGPDQNRPFLWTFSYTLKFPVASLPWLRRWYQATGHNIFIFNFLSKHPREPSMNARQKFLPF